MYKGRELKGMPVFALEEQKKIAQVEDLVVEHSTGKLLGFIVSNTGLWKTNKFLPYHAVSVLSPKGISVENKKVLQKNQKQYHALLQQDWLGAKVYDAKGADFGTVADVLLEYPQGNLSGVEISGGLVHDLSQGRTFLPWQEVRINSTHGFMTNFQQDRENLS